jgi:predicted ester cyclase
MMSTLKRPHFLTVTALFLASVVPVQLNAQLDRAHHRTGISEGNANATVILRLYEECLNQGRLESLPDLVRPNVINHFDDNEQTGLAAFEQNIRRVRAMFPNGHFTIDDVVSNGNKAAARWTMTAIFSVPIAGVAPTGKRITHDAIAFYRFDQGRIAEAWVQVDQIGALHQIGVNIPGLPASPAVTMAQ